MSSVLTSLKLISCLQLKKPIPSMMVKWMTEARRFETARERPSGELAEIIVRICTLISYPGEHSDTAELSQHISDILSTDECFEAWSVKYQNEYTITKGQRGSRDTYFGRRHSSSRVSIANSCNLCSCARIILHETLSRIISRHFEFHISLSAHSTSSMSYNRILSDSCASIRNSINDICRSVPFTLGYLENGQGRTDKIRAGCGVALLWPLYLAGTAHITTVSEREWIALELRKIEEITGVQRAKVAALCVRGSSQYPR